MPLSSEKYPMTPCEKLGYKVGDLFQVLETEIILKGSVIQLHTDDESDSPLFTILFGGKAPQYKQNQRGYAHLYAINPLTQTEDLNND